MRRVKRDEIVDYVTWNEDRRPVERPKVLALKEPRRIRVGQYLTLLFENADTVRYQIQEMMRTEQIVREDAIQHELDTYNELLGGDGELGFVLLIAINDPAERAVKLTEWLDLPRHLYAELDDGSRVPASYDARQIGDDRLSSVQYMKFDVGGRVPVALGSTLPGLQVREELTEVQSVALAQDLSG